MIGIVTHAAFYENGEIHGPADAVSKFLTENKITHLLLKHPLAGKYRSKLIKNTQRKATSLLIGPTPEGIARYVVDIYLTLKSFWQLKKPAIIIATDPLNCIAGVILKRLGKCQTLVYFTADFATNRFENKLLNSIYHLLDKISVQNADYCWSVSTRIAAYRTLQGVIEERNILIPNAPAFSKIKRRKIEDIHMYDLALVSYLKAGVEFKPLFASMKQLEKKYPELQLQLIGGGDGEKEVRAMVTKMGLEGRVHILGQQPHNEVHRILATCGIGIALYNDTAPWRYYSDSMKARDYMACGLPVIISGDLATVDDIVHANAGVYIKPQVKSITNAITLLLDNRETYKDYRRNAIALARKYDITAILEAACKPIL